MSSQQQPLALPEPVPKDHRNHLERMLERAKANVEDMRRRRLLLDNKK